MNAGWRFVVMYSRKQSRYYVYDCHRVLPDFPAAWSDARALAHRLNLEHCPLYRGSGEAEWYERFR